MSLNESAASGDRLKALQDLRDILAKEIVLCESSRDLAALSARFQSVLLEISLLDASSKKKAGDPVDEIAARRAARGGATARPGRADRSTS